MLEVIHHTGREFFHRYVVHTLLAEQEFFQIHHAAFPAQYRGFAYIATLVLLPHLHIDLAESLAEHLRLFEFAEEGSFKHIGIDKFVAHDELVMYLADFRAYRVKITVQFKVFLCLATRLAFGSVPVIGSYRPVDIDLRTLPVHRDTQGDGQFSLLVLPFPCDEVQGKIAFVG